MLISALCIGTSVRRLCVSRGRPGHSRLSSSLLFRDTVAPTIFLHSCRAIHHFQRWAANLALIGWPLLRIFGLVVFASISTAMVWWNRSAIKILGNRQFAPIGLGSDETQGSSSLL